MHSQCATLATFAVAILATVAKPLAPPTTGWLISAGPLRSGILPFTATQCEPFDIFYNSPVDIPIIVFDATLSHPLFTITIPQGTGYLEWICNIPPGFGFIVVESYVVQAGSSSACLGDLNTTYSLLNYNTANFASYTRAPFIAPLPPPLLPTASFPTGPFSTITLNPILAGIPPSLPPPTFTASSLSPPTFTTSSLPSSPLSSYPSFSSTSYFISSPSSSHPSPSPTTSPLFSLQSSSSATPTKTSPSSPTMSPSPLPHIFSIAGGVAGAVMFILLISALRHLWRSRRKRRGDLQLTTTSDLAMGESGSTYLSPPFQSSGTELLGSMPDPYSHGNQLRSDSSITVVPVASNPMTGVVPVAQSLVALSPVDIESTTGMPPATLSTQQAYDRSMINAGRDI